MQLFQDGPEEVEVRVRLPESERASLALLGRNAEKLEALRATLALPVDRHNSIKLYANSGVSTRTGSNFTTAGVAWQYRWGGM